jgi:hypothetical protein
MNTDSISTEKLQVIKISNQILDLRYVNSNAEEQEMRKEGNMIPPKPPKLE